MCIYIYIFKQEVGRAAPVRRWGCSQKNKTIHKTSGKTMN